jgi:hypothetical protein
MFLISSFLKRHAQSAVGCPVDGGNLFGGHLGSACTWAFLYHFGTQKTKIIIIILINYISNVDEISVNFESTLKATF